MDLKEILNKLVGENAETRVHGSCSFRFMGSCHNIIFFADLCRHAGRLAEVGPVFFKFQSMSVNLDPRVAKRNDPAGNKLAFLSNRPHAQEIVSVPK